MARHLVERIEAGISAAGRQAARQRLRRAAEQGIGQVSDGIAEVRMIQDIEELGAELKAILFDCGNFAAGASNPIRERRERELYSVGQMLDETSRRARRAKAGGRMNITRMKQLLTGAALVALVLSSNGRSQDTEPTECGTPKMHACHCPRLVGDVQGRMTEECHRNSEKREKYITCLREIPEACDIVEQPYRWMTPEEQERNMGNQCSTRCKKDACRCNEDVCGR